MNDDLIVGGTGLPQDVSAELGDLVARLAETHQFKHGSTAAYFALAFTLAQHLGQGLK